MPGLVTPASPRSAPVRRAVIAFVLLGLGVGALAGVGWWLLVDLPSYQVTEGGNATTGERGLTELFGADAWFCLLGAGAGLVLGLVAWRRFRDLGWGVVPLGTLTAVAAALICWEVGVELGPQDFTGRIASAQPGDVVPVDLTLRTRASLLVWPFFAVVPLLLGSSLGRDDEDPSPVLRPDARDHTV